MKKIAVVYWSGTGNTEAMAEAVLKGAQSAGASAALFSAGSFSAEEVDHYDALAFGCPAMGSEMLEDSEFEPMFNECRPLLKGKSKEELLTFIKEQLEKREPFYTKARYTLDVSLMDNYEKIKISVGKIKELLDL